jgi:hypothetical protein
MCKSRRVRVGVSEQACKMNTRLRPPNEYNKALAGQNFRFVLGGISEHHCFLLLNVLLGFSEERIKT